MLPLDHDDRADALGRQRAGRDHELLDRLVVAASAARSSRKNGARPEVRERAADVGLEQHDGGEDDVADDVADQPVDRLELAATATRRTGRRPAAMPTAICTARVPRISFSSS